MASVGLDVKEYMEGDSDGSDSETEINKIDGSFVDNVSEQAKSMRGFSMSKKSNRRGLALLGLNKKSFASEVDNKNQMGALSRSIDEKILSETGARQHSNLSDMKKKKR